MGSSGYKVGANHSLGSGLLMDRGPHRSPRTRWKRHKEVEEFLCGFCREYTHWAESKPTSRLSLSPVSWVLHTRRLFHHHRHAF